MNDCLIGKADLKEVLLPYLSQWKWEKSVEELLDFWFKSESPVDSRVLQHITRVRHQGVKCCLATNQEKYRTAYMLKEMGLAPYFDQIFSSAYLGVKKPSQEFFSTVLQDLQGSIPDLQKSEVLLIDDDSENIAGAEKFGIQVLHYTSYEDLLKNGEDWL